MIGDLSKRKVSSIVIPAIDREWIAPLMEEDERREITGMKDPWLVLRQKEAELEETQKDVFALCRVVRLVADGEVVPLSVRIEALSREMGIPYVPKEAVTDLRKQYDSVRVNVPVLPKSPQIPLEKPSTIVYYLRELNRIVNIWL